MKYSCTDFAAPPPPPPTPTPSGSASLLMTDNLSLLLALVNFRTTTRTDVGTPPSVVRGALAHACQPSTHSASLDPRAEARGAVAAYVRARACRISTGGQLIEGYRLLGYADRHTPSHRGVFDLVRGDVVHMSVVDGTFVGVVSAVLECAGCERVLEVVGAGGTQKALVVGSACP